MFKNYIQKWFWRKNRLKYWKKRLTLELKETSRLHPLGIPIILHVSWGPFFNGSAWLNHKQNRATIHVQIPYDGHLTTDDQEILTAFRLSVRRLPQFILNHEYFHLLDAYTFEEKNLKRILKERQMQARSTAAYHQLQFEEQADRFALACLREKINKAC